MLINLLTIFLLVSVTQAPSDFDRTLSLEQLIGKLNSDSPLEHAVARQLLPFHPPIEVLHKIVPSLASDNPDISWAARNVLFDITNQMTKGKNEEKRPYVEALLGYFADTTLKDTARENILKALTIIIDDETNPAVFQEYLLKPEWMEKVRVALVENGTMLSAQILCNSLNSLDDEGKVSILLGLSQMKTVPCIDTVVPYLNSNYLPLKTASALVLSNTGSVTHAQKILDLCKSIPETEPAYKDLWDAYVRLADKCISDGGNWDYAIRMYRDVMEFCKLPSLVQSGIAGLGRFGDETVIPDLEAIILSPEKEEFYSEAFHAIKTLNLRNVRGADKGTLELCAKLPSEKQVYLIPALILANNEESKNKVNELLSTQQSSVKKMFLNAFYENPSLLYVDYIPTITQSLDEIEKQKLVECIWRTLAQCKEIEETEKQTIGRAYLNLFKLCPQEEREIVLEGIKKFPVPETVDVLLPELSKEDPQKLPFPILFELYNVIPNEQQEQKDKVKNILLEQLAEDGAVEKIIAGISSSKNIQQFLTLAGFVDMWNLIGPFPWDKNDPFVETYGFPQSVQLDVPLKYNDKEYVWQKGVKAVGWGYVDLMGLCSQASIECSNLCAFAYTKIEVPEDVDAVACFGSDDGFRLWINNVEVAQEHVDRGMKVDEDKVKIHLNKGENDILLQITQILGGWNFCFRLTDTSGKPLTFNIKPL